MAKLQFADLSAEIKALIFSHIFRPTDLISLCLTSKQFHEIAVKQLYHTITLDLGADTDRRIPSLLSPRNIGLKDIRSVELYRADVTHNCNQLQQANLACRMLLEFLPNDSLDKFSWHPWCPFSAENYALLYKRQKKMKWLEAIALDESIDDKYIDSIKLDDITENCTKVGLYPDSRDTLKLCHELLSRVKRVEKITLHTNFEDAEPPIPNSELNDNAVHCGLVTRTIFKHMLPFEKCAPMVLNELTLQKVYLRFASESYCRVIDFTKLKILRVFGCVGADSLISELSKSSKLPDKLEVLEFKHEDDGEGEAVAALDVFLALITGLKDLTIEMACAKALPSIQSITRHKKTLELLNVHAYGSQPGDSDEEEMVYEVDSFAKLCRECTFLEQLSVAAPPTSILRNPSDEFNAFSTATNLLPNLITINITTWPTNNPTSTRLPRKQYEFLLQGMAQQGFEKAVESAIASGRGSSKLKIIAFGTAERIYEREDGKNVVVFVRGKQTDPLGRESPVAIPIGWCLRKYAEPESDVLDFVSALRGGGKPVAGHRHISADMDAW